MTTFLITLDAKRVNEQNTLWFCGGPHLMAAWGLATSLSFEIQDEDNRPKVEAISYVLHEKNMLGDFSSDGNTFVAQQRRGALTYNKDDLNSKGQYPGNLSIQPVIESDSRVSVLVQYDREIPEHLIRKRMVSSRFAGGRIESFHVSSHDDFSAAFKKCSGFAFEVCPELVDPKDPIESIVKVLFEKPLSLKRAEELGVERPPAFVSPCVVGYEQISAPRPKVNVREGLEHMFVEPVATLGRYVSTRKASQEPERFKLRPEWRGEVFHLVKNSNDQTEDFIL